MCPSLGIPLGHTQEVRGWKGTLATLTTHYIDYFHPPRPGGSWADKPRVQLSVPHDRSRSRTSSESKLGPVCSTDEKCSGAPCPRPLPGPWKI